MKKLLFTLCALCLCGTICAYDFEDGGFYYNILSGTQNVEVTYGGTEWTATAAYTGELKIPTTATNGSNTYTVTAIGEAAFAYCTLTAIEIPETVTSIGYSAFAYCYSITSIEIPDNVTSLGTYAFYDCEALEKAIVGDGVTILDQQVFDWCLNLKEVTLGKNITTIGKWAFECNYALEYITLPESVTEILQSAFYYCTSLKEITIPDNVTTLGTYAFCGCSSLVKAVVGDGLTILDQQVFDRCDNLKDVTLGKNITSIGKWAFEYDYALENITLPESVTEILQSAFYYCTSLKEITIPDNVTTMGTYIFEGCSALEKAVIGNSVTTIDRETFCFCYGLKEVIIGKGVTSLGDYAFYDNTSLNSFVSLNPTPPTCATQVFYDIPSTCPLYVPAEAVGDYSSASTWKNFYTIAELIPTTLIPLEPTDVTDNSAVIVGTTAKGSLPVRERGFEFWLDADDVQTIISDVTEDGEFTAEVSDLTYGTTYTYRVYAITLNGEEYSEERTFTTETYAPEVKTLAATDVTDVSAVLNGTVEQGSEPITKKGFEYWKNSSSNVKTSITVTTEEMSYTLENLTPETAYTYRSYAVTDSGYVYGEEITFTTDVPTGLGSIVVETENVEGYYTTSGQKLAAPQKGVNIVRYADGTTKKVLIK